jgi:hypothetical protein
MADKTFNIRIITTNEPAGSREAARNLDELAGATRNVAKDADEATLKGKEWNLVLNEINKVAPGLGTALKGLFSPAALGIAGAILITRQLVTSFIEAREAARKLREEAEATWLAQRDALEELRRSADDFAAAIGKAKKPAEEVSAVLDAMLDRQKILQGDQFSEADADSQRLSMLGGRRQSLARAGAAIADRVMQLGLDVERGAPGAVEAERWLGQADGAAILARASEVESAIAFRMRSMPGITRDQAIINTQERAALNALETFERNRSIVDAQRSRQDALEAARREQLANQSDLSRLDSDIATRSRVLGIRRINEPIAGAMRSLGAGDISELVPRLYPQMHSGQQQAIVQAIQQGGEKSQQLLQMIVQYILSHQAQIEAMAAQLRGTRNR